LQPGLAAALTPEKKSFWTKRLEDLCAQAADVTESMTKLTAPVAVDEAATVATDSTPIATSPRTTGGAGQR